jgi:hypothetical protein
MQPAAPPEAVLTQIAFGAMMTQALYVAAKLGIADLLKDAPQPVSELAAATGTHERSLYRVLRSLAGAGIFQETESKVFANTPLSDAIRAMRRTRCATARFLWAKRGITTSGEI